MATITVMCDKCWNSSTYSVPNELSSGLIAQWLEEHIAKYEKMADLGDGIADPRTYRGKVQALKEFKWHLSQGEFYDT